jgi:uncharacterized protein
MIELVKIGKRPQSSGMFGSFRYREVGGEVLLTNFLGDWVFVSKDEFSGMARGEVSEGSPLYDRLATRNFVRSKIDVDKAVERVSRKKRFLDYGPNLHVMVVTLRCNESCVYCHAARADMDQVQTDMSKETAERSVDLALQTTSPSLTIEFQGGEPLVNFAVVKHIIEYAIVKNRAYGKQLEFTMVSNLALMDDEKLRYLVDHKVQICTSIDGPEALHNKQRILAGGNAWQQATKWIKRINQEYERMGLDPVLYHVEALLTTTRALLDYPTQIVDAYVDLGCRAIFIRPVDPFGWAEKTAKTVEYNRKSYIDFYRQATDYIIDLNKKGVQVLERFGAIFLTKILGDEEPNFLDVRSPGGAAIGQLAYGYDGKIYSSDEGRMLAATGDDFFKIGDVGVSTYRELMTHPTVRAMTLASNLESQPDCVNCTYNPYCGIVPEHNYRTQGSLFGRMRESKLCQVHKGIQDYLFNLLRQNDPQTIEIMRRWTTVRERTHFQQASSASLPRREPVGSPAAARRGAATPALATSGKHQLPGPRPGAGSPGKQPRLTACPPAFGGGGPRSHARGAAGGGQRDLGGRRGRWRGRRPGQLDRPGRGLLRWALRLGGGGLGGPRGLRWLGRRGGRGSRRADVDRRGRLRGRRRLRGRGWRWGGWRRARVGALGLWQGRAGLRGAGWRALPGGSSGGAGRACAAGGLEIAGELVSLEADLGHLAREIVGALLLIVAGLLALADGELAGGVAAIEARGVELVLGRRAAAAGGAAREPEGALGVEVELAGVAGARLLGEQPLAVIEAGDARDGLALGAGEGAVAHAERVVVAALPAPGSGGEQGRGAHDGGRGAAGLAGAALLLLAGEQHRQLVAELAHRGPPRRVRREPALQVHRELLAGLARQARQRAGAQRGALPLDEGLLEPAAHLADVIGVIGVSTRKQLGPHEAAEQRGGEAVGVDALAEIGGGGVAVEAGEDGPGLLGGGEEQRPGDGQRRAGGGGGAEIEHEREARVVERREEDVLWLDVLVPQAGGVEHLEPLGDGREDLEGLAQDEGPAGQLGVERAALVEGHREPDVVGLDPVVGELDDVRVADGREQPELALRIAARVHLGAQHLERDAVLVHVGPDSAVDAAELALAEEIGEAVPAPDLLAHAGQLRGVEAGGAGAQLAGHHRGRERPLREHQRPSGDDGLALSEHHRAAGTEGAPEAHGPLCTETDGGGPSKQSKRPRPRGSGRARRAISGRRRSRRDRDRTAPRASAARRAGGRRRPACRDRRPAAAGRSAG